MKHLVIKGNGQSNGGRFEKVRIAGKGEVFGDTESGLVRVSGKATFHGNVSTSMFSVSGKTVIDANVTAESFKTSGKAVVGGTLRGTTGKINGSLETGKVEAEHFKVRGMIHVRDNLDCEVFDLKGIIHAQGLVNAQQIRIKMHGRNTVKEMGGEEIRIVPHKEHHWLSRLLRLTSRNPILEAELIEGTQLQLTNVHAAVVRGDNVRIGPGCVIGLVEYRNDLQVHPKAKVESQRTM